LEPLEGRALLSTYTLSETYVNFGPYQVPAVVFTIDGKTTYSFGSPLSPFTFTTAPGSNTVNIRDTSAGIPVDVFDEGMDTVNVGYKGSVQGILARVYFDSYYVYGAEAPSVELDLDDSADNTSGRLVVLSNGSTYKGGTPYAGDITGLAPATITYVYSSISSIRVAMGPGANTVSVRGTGVPTAVVNQSGGLALVGVGYGGSLSGIDGNLTVIGNTSSQTYLYLEDSADPNVETAYLTAGFLLPVITGLSPAPISYGGLTDLEIDTGPAADTVDVYDTYCPTRLWGEGADIINVGYDNSLSGITGALTVGSDTKGTTLNIDDWYVPAPSTASLVNGAPGWGLITGLAPAAINFESAAVESVHIFTPGMPTWTVTYFGAPVYDDGVLID
jgi:hypothetical protein